MTRPITGLMMYYSEVCKRKLWYVSRGIELESQNEDVQIGRRLQKQAYKRKKRKDVLIDGTISFDILEDGDVIYEVKKSSSLEKASRLQLKYYLWYMETKKNQNYSGVLAYPRERKREEVTLGEEDYKKIPDRIEEIRNIVMMESPPSVKEKPYCVSCAFYDLCWV